VRITTLRRATVSQATYATSAFGGEGERLSSPRLADSDPRSTFDRHLLSVGKDSDVSILFTSRVLPCFRSRWPIKPVAYFELSLGN
jgi:hypothetical protein